MRIDVSRQIYTSATFFPIPYWWICSNNTLCTDVQWLGIFFLVSISGPVLWITFPLSCLECCFVFMVLLLPCVLIYRKHIYCLHQIAALASYKPSHFFNSTSINSLQFYGNVYFCVFFCILLIWNNGSIWYSRELLFLVLWLKQPVDMFCPFPQCFAALAYTIFPHLALSPDTLTCHSDKPLHSTTWTRFFSPLFKAEICCHFGNGKLSLTRWQVLVTDRIHHSSASWDFCSWIYSRALDKGHYHFCRFYQKHDSSLSWTIIKETSLQPTCSFFTGDC